MKLTKKFKIFIVSVISFISLIILIVSLFFVFNPIFNDPQLTLRVGSYENAPKIYTNNEGNVVGFFPELLEYIALKEGWKIEYVNGTWVQCLERLENNEIDIMVDVAYTETRAEKYDFTNIDVLTNWGIVYKKVGAIIETHLDLEGKLVAVMAGSVHTDGEMGIKNITKQLDINCTFIELDDYYQVFEMLTSGGADVGIVNRLFGIFNEEQYEVKVTSILFNSMGLRFAFPKNASMNQYLITSLDKQLLELIEDTNSKYYELLESYIYGSNEFRIPEWIIITVITSVGLVALFFSTSAILNYKVRTRTTELQKAEEKYREAYNRTEFYKDVFAHDINNILQIILSGIQINQLILDNPEKRKDLKINDSIIREQVIRGKKLVSNVRKLSQLEETKQILKKIGIFNVLENVISLVKKSNKDKNLDIRIDSIYENVFIKANDYLEDVFENLLINAIKHNRKIIIDITVKISREQQSGINYLKMEFLDNGNGVNDSMKVNIFKRGYTEGKCVLGMGLGLSLVQGIIETYDGKIWVEDRVKGVRSKGSNFVLLIPEVD